MLNTSELQAIRDFSDISRPTPLRSALEKFITSLRAEHVEKMLIPARDPKTSHIAGQHSAVVKELDDFLSSFEKWEGK